ncbi:MAG: HNH endonuclease [Actinobacteria bacterium]|nr:HNH endonuclease [Actinomycetota bacterium]
MGTNRHREAIIERLDLVQYELGGMLRQRMRTIVELDEFDGWEQLGARDLAHYLCMSLGISEWKARRLIECAHALEKLPRIAEAFATGLLSEDKVVELTRFATPEDEGELVRWANTVSGSWIRKKADLMERQRLKDARRAEKQRYLGWYFTGDRFRLELEVPRAEGPRIVARLREVAKDVPILPDEEATSARLADAAMVLLTSSGEGTAEATVIIHARLDDLVAGDRACSVQGEAVHPETARRLACHSRFRLMLENDQGEPLKLGRTRRDPTTAQRIALQKRDEHCVFPGCGATRYLVPHHIGWWSHGGRTDLDPLVLVCTFHHKLVHEYGWRIERSRSGEVWWYRPGGARYRAERAPPNVPIEDPINYGYVASYAAAN